MQTFRSKFIGDRVFYKTLLTVALPIMLQQGITNFVALLDNIMVGQVGTEAMSGVAIVNQLLNVYNICIFGAVSGAGIFCAQFFGSGNTEGVRHAYRFKLYAAFLFLILGVTLLLLFPDQLISLYLKEGGETAGDLQYTLQCAREYLFIMLLGLPAFALTQCYSTTLRETKETILPMTGSILAVLTNTCLNYILIFGNFGFPVLGVKGAAIATVIARYVELSYVVIRTHRNSARFPFIRGIYRSMRIPLSLTANILKKGFPLIMNETLWSVGTAVIMQCYAVRGLAVVAGFNISSTIVNFFNIIFYALGNSVAIIVGQLLGAGKIREARDTDTKLIFTGVALHVVIGGIMAACSGLFPQIYNTTETVRSLASQFLLVSACFMPLQAFNHCCYFTLRSGGQTVITFLFDSFSLWCLNIPIANLLVRGTTLPIVAVYALVTATDICKAIIGFFMLKSGRWARNIIPPAEEQGLPSESSEESVVPEDDSAYGKKDPLSSETEAATE